MKRRAWCGPYWSRAQEAMLQEQTLKQRLADAEARISQLSSPTKPPGSGSSGSSSKITKDLSGREAESCQPGGTPGKADSPGSRGAVGTAYHAATWDQGQAATAPRGVLFRPQEQSARYHNGPEPSLPDGPMMLLPELPPGWRYDASGTTAGTSSQASGQLPTWYEESEEAEADVASVYLSGRYPMGSEVATSSDDDRTHWQEPSSFQDVTTRDLTPVMRREGVSSLPYTHTAWLSSDIPQGEYAAFHDRDRAAHSPRAREARPPEGTAYKAHWLGDRQLTHERVWDYGTCYGFDALERDYQECGGVFCSDSVRVKRQSGVRSSPQESSAGETCAVPSANSPVVITASVGFDLGTTEELVVIDPQHSDLVDPIVSSFIDPKNLPVRLACLMSTRHSCQCMISFIVENACPSQSADWVRATAVGCLRLTVTL